MGRMTWDLATLQYHRWAGRAGWEADSDYTVDRRGRLWIRACMPRRTSWTYRVAREVLPCVQGFRVKRSNEPVAGGCA